MTTKALKLAPGIATSELILGCQKSGKSRRAQRVPGMITVEEPLALAEVIQTHCRPDTLVVVDCLSLWPTNLLMPAMPQTATYFDKNMPLALMNKARVASLLIAIEQATGPLVLAGNKIGLGVISLGREARAFVDALGLLNQSVAAGLPLTLKDVP